ncbi:glycosyltransferase family 4 protein [Thermophagus xiamenensis]|uniref:Glycosyltransferase involved in cell wall bisynthesis n=1 Tax=Thermophagus xiamenensis TaxID=385682 RepID=A0A1I2FTI4_9BACT|nr:glycosyltransferase family 4 protein [Thermophagus xiamenensis]SFF08724.1 Glycosyltransferase involved in cell wall bisynthesis [Thermophagus xiamenensis]
MTILFQYTELASYFLAGVRELVQQGHAVHIVRWPVNKEAPFRFTFPEGVTVYERQDYNTRQLVALVRTIRPDLIITSGWVDKGYLQVCRKFKETIPTVMSMDNHWLGTARQQVMRLAAPLLLHRFFTHAWVPGAPQKHYALKLGFRPERIAEGFYCADVDHFSGAAPDRCEASPFPRKLIYVGRYVHQKGLDLLFPAFMELQKETPNDWELWCAGTGDLYDQRPTHPKIKHLGFLQPDELKETLKGAGVFVLPSRFEPWGVVVHEMAAAGFPMICSSAVGAATRFLEDGKNGYLFQNESRADLKQALKRMMSLSDEELRTMARHSHKLGMSYTPKMWAEQAVRTIGQ